MIPVLAVSAVLGLMYGSILGLTFLLADEPVFTRAAFAEFALMASKAMHRAPRTPLRERFREWRQGPERLADLSQPLDHETTGPPCPLCLGIRTRKPCNCPTKCEHPFCEGEAA